jgi:organic radical activating enzyme
MLANNLTISVPSRVCDKGCPYCISRVTPSPKIDKQTFYENIPKLKKLIDNVGITSILITGKGEPFLYFELERLIDKFKEYPLEIQTNGERLSKAVNNNVTSIEVMLQKPINAILKHINVLSISVDSFSQYKSLQQLIGKIKHTSPSTIIRLSFNVTKQLLDLPDDLDIDYYIKHSAEAGVRQVTFRRVSLPDTIPTSINDDNKIISSTYAAIKGWIEENANAKMFATCYAKLHKLIENLEAPCIRKFNFGGEVYDLGGLSLALMDVTCVQENHNEDNLRSLIYHQDGHLYTSWNSLGSILF